MDVLFSKYALLYWLLPGAVAAAIVTLWFKCSELRDYVKDHHEGITIILALLAGIYVVREYLEDLKNQRVANSLEYIQRIQSGDVAEARRSFDLFWIDNVEIVEATRSNDKAISAAAISELQKKVEDPGVNPGGRENIIRMFYFYSDIAACSNLGLCDTDTLCAYFGGDIRNFHVLTGGFMEVWERVSFEEPIQEIILFVDRCPKVKVKTAP